MFETKTPIYIQLIELFQQNIVSGKWPSNSTIDSVRSLALKYQVNPNTVFKALSELESQGLLINDGTLGKRVNPDERLLATTREEIFNKAKNTFLRKAQELGYQVDEVVQILNEEGENL